jgi:hypothetical protein
MGIPRSESFDGAESMTEGWSEMSELDALAAQAETGSFPINIGDLWDGIWLADIDEAHELDDEDYPNEVTD